MAGALPPIDRPILEFLQTRLQAKRQVSHAAITDASGHFELQVVLASSYYPASVDDAILTVRWYTNDDFTAVTARKPTPRGGRKRVNSVR